MAELTAAQHRAIAALMIAPTVADAAKAARVHRATLHRWLADASFCDELRRAGDDAIAAAVRQLTTLSISALAVLRDAMGADVTVATRLRAADIALGKLLSLRELHELERRVAALEGRHEH